MKPADEAHLVKLKICRINLTPCLNTTNLSTSDLGFSEALDPPLTLKKGIPYLNFAEKIKITCNIMASKTIKNAICHFTHGS